MRTLDQKLAKIKAGTYTPADFIIADAKDGDIGFGGAQCAARQRRHYHEQDDRRGNGRRSACHG